MSFYFIEAGRTCPTRRRRYVGVCSKVHGRVQLTRLGCAIERFCGEKGDYPITLEQLAPEYVPAMVRGCVANAGFHYHRTGDGFFLLYWAAAASKRLTGRER